MMAVERESGNQEDLNSFAHLLRTFLPDHDDLSLNNSTALLGQNEAHKSKEDGASEEVSGTQTVYDAGPDTGSKYQKKVPIIEQFAPLQSEDKPPVLAPAAQIVDNEPPEAKRTDPDFEPNSEEEEDEGDSDATVEIPISELREACPSLVSKVQKERAANRSKSKDGHLLDASKKKWYACFVCDDQYGDVDSYKMHMSQHCEEAGSIKCQHCDLSFPSEMLYNSHRKVSAFEILVDRMELKKAVENGLDMTKTEGRKGRKATNQESYICNVCGKSLQKFPAFLKHVISHDGAFKFQCAVCQEGFSQPCLLRSHIDLQHPHVLPFQCRRCLKRFKLRGSLATHLKTCDVDPSSLPYAQEMQYIDQLSQRRKLEGVNPDEDGSAQYSCPICMVMYDSPEDLQKHMRHHDETKPYRCKICGRGFSSKSMVQKHQVVHRQESKNCKCEICGVELLTRSGYNAHLRGHRNQEIIQAKILAEQRGEAAVAVAVAAGTAAAAAVEAANREGQPPVSPSEMDKALKILQNFQKDNVTKNRSDVVNANLLGVGDGAEVKKTKPKKYACPFCGMMFHTSGEKFQAHCRRNHKDADFVKCDICNKLFVGQENLDRHRKAHSLFTDTFPCDECDKVFRRKFALQVHKKMHSFKKFVKCDICGQEFRFVSEVDKHKNKMHRYDKLTNIYKCTICGQRFPVLSHLSVHCYCHSNEPDASPFGCDLCNSSFKTSTQLKQHIFQKHQFLMKNMGETGDFPENSTGEGFDGVQIKTEPLDEDDPANQNGELNAMDKEKQGPTPDMTDMNEVAMYNLTTLQFSHKSKILKRYSCEVCGKAFASNSDLKTHRRTHSGETPFKCDYCDRSFKQRGHRKLHIQVVHTKEMPYKCNQCDAAFPTRYRYQIHLKRHTGIRDYKCQWCEKEFYTLGKLNDHAKRRHPQEWKRAQLKAQGITEDIEDPPPPPENNGEESAEPKEVKKGRKSAQSSRKAKTPRKRKRRESPVDDIFDDMPLVLSQPTKSRAQRLMDRMEKAGDKPPELDEAPMNLSTTSTFTPIKLEPQDVDDHVSRESDDAHKDLQLSVHDDEREPSDAGMEPESMDTSDHVESGNFGRLDIKTENFGSPAYAEGNEEDLPTDLSTSRPGGATADVINGGSD